MTDPVTPAQIERRLGEIAERASATSPGPWRQTHDMKLGVKLWDAEGHPLFAAIGGIEHSRISEADPIPQWRKDCDFAREARKDIPWLLEVAATLQADVRRLHEILADVLGLIDPEDGDLVDRINAELLPCSKAGHCPTPREDEKEGKHTETPDAKLSPGASSFLKCKLAGVTSSEASDWRAKWPACGAWRRADAEV